MCFLPLAEGVEAGVTAAAAAAAPAEGGGGGRGGLRGSRDACEYRLPVAVVPPEDTVDTDPWSESSESPRSSARCGSGR